MSRFKKRAITLAVGCIIGVVPVAARPRHWYTDKWFWVGEGVGVAARTLDCTSTQQRLSQGYAEGNLLVGPHPGRGAVIGLCVGSEAALTGLHIVSWKYSHNEPSKLWRNVGRWEVPAIQGGVFGSAAARNYSLPKLR